MNCPACKTSVPLSSDRCQACGTDVGFPNVRMAASQAERDALAKRFSVARHLAINNGALPVFDEFGIAMLSSSAAVARGLSELQLLISDGRRTYASYHGQVIGESRIPEDNIFDSTRDQFESALFPAFYSKVRFGYLVLGNRILTGYGAFVMILKSQMIEKRATVFEENPFNFVRKHNIQIGALFPEGYRAIWTERNILAQIKHARDLQASMIAQDFTELLVKDTCGTASSEFIEVHIYGTFSRDSIARVVGPKPVTAADSVVVTSLRNDLQRLNIDLELV